MPVIVCFGLSADVARVLLNGCCHPRRRDFRDAANRLSSCRSTVRSTRRSSSSAKMSDRRYISAQLANRHCNRTSNRRTKASTTTSNVIAQEPTLTVMDPGQEESSSKARGKGHRIRLYHQKSRNGCQRCKQRRVKVCSTCSLHGDNNKLIPSVRRGAPCLWELQSA